MKSNRNIRIFLAMIVLIFGVLACGLVAPVEPDVLPETDTPIPLPSPTATITPRPTSTPRPSATPNVVATERYDELFTKVQEFKDEGLIPDTSGEYAEIEDFREEFSQLGWYQSWIYNFEVEHFVFVAHLKWSTAAETSDISGCGVVFGQQEDSSDYAVFLDKSRVYFTSSTPSFYSELGKTRGTGRLSFGNPAEADLALLVYDKRAFVYVDDEFIGEYTLSQDEPLRGHFGYGIISGTNRDYGTRCEVSDARMWDLNP